MSNNISWYQLITVGIGGMLGACLRHGISLLFMETGSFPFATLTVNLIGCFGLSFCLDSEWIKKLFQPQLLTALTVGVIGSLTTFSTFAIETIELMNVSGVLTILYILASLVGGLFMCYLGFRWATKRSAQK